MTVEDLGRSKGFSRMTIEELKAEFAKYLADSIDYYSTEEPLTDRKLLQIWLDCAEPREKKILELQKENEQLKQLVLYLEDNLRVARKDREDLKDAVANGLEEFVKDNPMTSLQMLANKKDKEEKQYETCPYRSTDMGCDYCDYRDRDLKDEV